MSYRLLEKGEPIQVGDEFYVPSTKSWIPVSRYGAPWDDGYSFVRRPITTPTAPASEWVLWSERPPTLEDADTDQRVMLLLPTGRLCVAYYGACALEKGTLWRPTNPPVPTPEQEARAAAEKAWEAGSGGRNKADFIATFIAGYLAGKEAK